MKYDGHALGKFFNPFTPLYQRKLTDALELKEVLTGVLAISRERPILAMGMSIGLYESHRDLYLHLAGVTGSSDEVVGSQIEILRTVVKTTIDHAEYNDYLITLWSCTGDARYMTELVARTTSAIEEVSVSSTWLIDTISKNSEVFAHAIAVARTSN